MIQAEIQKILSDSFNKCSDILKSKGKDYTNGNDDGLVNFKQIATQFKIKPDLALGIFMNKHYSAIQTYILTGQVESEPIQERITDMINYLVLLRCLIIDEAKQVKTNG